MQYEDRMNKHFFASVQERLGSGIIIKLYDEDNTIVLSSVNLARVGNSFYSKLYACPIEDENKKIIMMNF